METVVKYSAKRVEGRASGEYAMTINGQDIGVARKNDSGVGRFFACTPSWEGAVEITASTMRELKFLLARAYDARQSAKPKAAGEGYAAAGILSIASRLNRFGERWRAAGSAIFRCRCP